MDSFRKAHSSTSLKSRLPKGTSGTGVNMRLKLKKLLYDFSKNNLDSIRKETIREYSDDTLNDTSLDCVQDVDDSSNIDFEFGDGEEVGEDVREKISPKTDTGDGSVHIHNNSKWSSDEYGNLVTKSQSIHPLKFASKDPEISDAEEEPSELHHETIYDDIDELSDRSEESDSSNAENIVLSEGSSDLGNQSSFDIRGGLASAIRANIPLFQELDKELSDSTEESECSYYESTVSNEESADMESQSSFDISGRLASAIKENLSLFQKHENEFKKNMDVSCSSMSDFLTNSDFSIDSQINLKFMATLDNNSDSIHSDNLDDGVEFDHTLVCKGNQSTNIKSIFSNYVCRIGYNEQNCNQFIPVNVTNMFKVRKDSLKSSEVFIPKMDVQFEAHNPEEQHNIDTRSITVGTNLTETVSDLCYSDHDTLAESSCANFDDTVATPNLDDTVDESRLATLEVTVTTNNLAAPRDHSQKCVSSDKGEANSDTVTNSSKQCHNDVQIHMIKNGCVVIIKYPSCMYIEGKVIVRSLCGHVEIFGYKLNENPVNVFSPRYNYSMRLKTFPNEGDTYGLFSKLTHLGLSVAKTEDIVTSLSLHDAVLFMEPLKEPLCPFIETHWSLAIKTSDKAYSKQSPDLFSKTKSCYDEEFFEASQTLVDCSLYANKPTKQLQENLLWDSLVLLGQETNSVALIAGGKNVGKSTLLRYYVNKLLTRGPVAVVDLDPGQSEFTIAGNISITVVKAPLLGPNFTHLQTPNLMLNLGLVNVMDNFGKYKRAVHRIADHLQSHVEYNDMPCVINTMGFTAAMGLKLIAYTILLFKPSVVAQLEAASDKHNFHINLSPTNVADVLNGFDNDELFDSLDLKHLKKEERYLYYEFIQIQHDVKKQYKFSLAKQQRYLNVLGYFSKVLHSSNNFLLNGAKPFFVSQANIKFGFNVPVHDDMLFHVLNAKIVALCNDDNEEHKLGKAFLMGDCAYICYGHGIVRGVDIERGLVYLITPVDLLAMERVNALMYAEHMPELHLARRELQGGAHVPYREPVASPRHARLMAAPRRRFNPMRVLRPKHLLRPPPH